MPTWVAPATLTAGQRENVNDLNSIIASIGATLNNIDAANLANGAVTGDKLGTTLAQQLGVTNAANVGRGKTNIATSESRTNVAYGTLTTPDQVTGIVLPTDGLLVIGYQATWQESVQAAARAAIFIGANQLKVADSTLAAPTVQEAGMGVVGAAIDKPLATSPTGLHGAGGAAVAYTGDVTTGQIVGASSAAGEGGPVTVFAAAGTYTVSVQFKSSSGSVTVKNRKLWVWSIGF